MTKKPDVGRRKKLRYAMCALYLLQIVVCTMPFIQFTNADGELDSASPFFMFTMLFGVVNGMTSDAMIYCVMCIIIILVPTAGFFFCALDKVRNIKNIASLLLCFIGVYIVLAVSRRAVSLGAVIALVLYIILMLLTTMSIVMRLSNDEEETDKKEETEKK